MITNKGKSIISKFLLGQSPAYASYIAIGTGATPTIPGHVFTNTEKTTMMAKDSLDYEVLRVPITSRGYVTEDGVSKLVLTAQIPADGRYGITEVGIFPAIANPVAVNNESRQLLSFQPGEQWQTYAVDQSSVVVETNTFTASDGNITAVSTPFFANAFDTVLQSQTRSIKSEIPRNGTYALVLPGNLTTFNSGTNTISTGNYLVLANPGINLSQSSPTDKLKIAFSVLSNNLSDPVTGTAKIVVEFSSADGLSTGRSYAQAVFDVDISDTTTGTKRYFVKSIDIKDIVGYNGFSWSSASYVKVFAYANSGVSIAIDGLRVDNVNSLSPIYGLVGYTVIKNSLLITTGTEEAVPVVKDKDKTSFIEFRFQASVI
jgi:hypothetical protein